MATVTPGYTWTSGEVVTPAKMNSAAAPTVAVADGEVTASKLAASLDLSSKTVTLPNASVAQAKLAANVAGNGPAFRAYAAAATTIPNLTWTKVALGTEQFDTNNNFAASRFTPTVAGYYLIIGSVRGGNMSTGIPTRNLTAGIARNGIINAVGNHSNGNTQVSNVTNLTYLNGSTDYVELYAIHDEGTNKEVGSPFADQDTFLAGFLARAA
jgi:hypothetical protein